jgi:hypothetical protein
VKVPENNPISARPRSKFYEANLFAITQSKAYIVVVRTASKAATPWSFLPTRHHCFLTATASSSSSAAVARVSDAPVPVAATYKNLEAVV